MTDAIGTHVPPNPLDHQGLVGVIAKRFRGRGLGIGDLVQEGQVGLLLACERFDPTRDREFQSYARPYIKGHMRRAIRLQNKLIRLPAYWHAALAKLERGTIATNNLTGCHRERLFQAVQANQVDLWGLWVTGLYRDDPRLSTDWIDTDDVNQLWRVLDTLPARERQAVIWRYGLIGEPRLLADIGKELGVTKERARQLVNLGLERLRFRFGVRQEVA